jgi:hypothetical protein
VTSSERRSIATTDPGIGFRPLARSHASSAIRSGHGSRRIKLNADSVVLALVLSVAVVVRGGVPLS